MVAMQSLLTQLLATVVATVEGFRGEEAERDGLESAALRQFIARSNAENELLRATIVKSWVETLIQIAGFTRSPVVAMFVLSWGRRGKSPKRMAVAIAVAGVADAASTFIIMGLALFLLIWRRCGLLRRLCGLTGVDEEGVLDDLFSEASENRAANDVEAALPAPQPSPGLVAYLTSWVPSISWGRSNGERGATQD